MREYELQYAMTDKELISSQNCINRGIRKTEGSGSVLGCFRSTHNLLRVNYIRRPEKSNSELYYKD